MSNYEELNQLLLIKLSHFLSNNSKAITINQVNKLTKLGISKKRAFDLLLQNYLEIDNQVIINEYFPLMIKELDARDYLINPYYQNIHFDNRKDHNWELKTTQYDAYETFVCDDFQYFDDGKVVPQIGFFSKPFKYNAVYEKNHLWMSITPNEIETMKEPINNAFGDVITLGLGMGYYAYMVSLKDNVKSVTIVEKDPSIIKLFQEIILPQFSHKHKIKIVCQDAFDFLNSLSSHYDYLFADIWHDVSDGKNLYLKIKEYEVKHPDIHFEYWIEQTIKYYL